MSSSVTNVVLSVASRW